MSAKDVLSEAIKHKGEMDEQGAGPLTPKNANKKTGGKRLRVLQKENLVSLMLII